MIGNKFKSKSLTYRREHQDYFHHRERCADAGSRAVAEREVGVLWQAFDEFINPSLWFEFRRVVIKARVALRGPLKHEHLCSGWDAIAADLAIINCLATEAVSRRIEPHAFFRDLCGEFQARQIIHFGFASAEYFIQFGVKLPFDLRMFPDQIPRPGQR